MVLIRCEEHPPDRELYEWVATIEPVGYPETALVCGHRTHSEPVPGVAWLTDQEASQYEHGRRVFGLPSTATQIQLSETVTRDERTSITSE